MEVKNKITRSGREIWKGALWKQRSNEESELDVKDVRLLSYLFIIFLLLCYLNEMATWPSKI